MHLVTLGDTPTLGRISLDEGSVHRRGTTQHSQETNIYAHGGIRTRIPSKREAAHLRLRSRGHCDWRVILFRDLNGDEVDGLCIVRVGHEEFLQDSGK